MRTRLVVLFIILGVLVASPLALRRRDDGSTDHGLQLVVVTPHSDQIRFEFEYAFSRWHERNYGEPVTIAWLVPGGTTDSRRMLEAQFRAALRDNEPIGGMADLFFGGGTFEHERLKEGVSVVVDGKRRTTSVSAPVDFSQAWLDEQYGDNRIGSLALYDPDQHWFGLALSGFGIIWNVDLLEELEGESGSPESWVDLCDPRLAGWVALGNPAQSGSMRKTFDTILQFEGWQAGWRIIRRMSANARYFSASASTVPIDVAQGSAAAGTCIDFYGRSQVQTLESSGWPNRIRYIDPLGATVIDPDPISLLRGAPHPELATRFIEFCLSVEGQALWQFPVRSDDEALGPERSALRRLPIRRVMYREHLAEFIDPVDPYDLVGPVEAPDPYFWSLVPLLANAMAIDEHDRLQAAWSAIRTHPAYPSGKQIVTSRDVFDPDLRRMLERFDAMPRIPAPDGTSIALDTPESLRLVQEGWLEEGWRDAGLWAQEADPAAVLRRHLAAWFAKNYDAVCAIADERTAIAHTE